MPVEKLLYGYIPHPAIAYRIGGRTFVITVMSPVTYLQAVGPREVWNPLSGKGTNRKEDVQHRKDIARYVENTVDYVLNAVLVYASEEDAVFIRAEHVPDGAPIQLGTLYRKPTAKFTVGDGGHRTDGIGDTAQAHEPLNDEVYRRLCENGQPVIVCLDDDRDRRATDFVDLQKNAKPLNASMATSMNARETLRHVLIEQVIRDSAAIPLFGGGDRVDFQSDSPGRLSAKVAGYKTVRYASGTLLIGTDERTTKGWDEAVELELKKDEAGGAERLRQFWIGFGTLIDNQMIGTPPTPGVLARDGGMALLRDQSWLLASTVIYAIAEAVRQVTTVDAQITVAEAVGAFTAVDFDRSLGTGSPLNGTLVAWDDKSQKVKLAAGRPAWEGGAGVLAAHIYKQLGHPAA
jgi:hypothetical protein